MSDNKEMMESLQELLRSNRKLMDTMEENKQKHLEALAAKDELYAKQNEQLQLLVESLGNLGTAAAAADGDGPGANRAHHAPPIPVRSAEEIRKDKTTNVYQNLQKTPKIKDFKLSTQENIREWLLKINTIESLSTAVNIKVTDIKDVEYVNMIKSKLDYVIISELNLKFAAHDPVLKWETITKAELNAILIDQFGIREPEVSAVLRIFGSNRLKKSNNIDVRNFYAKWWEDLPLCLKPTDAAGNKKLVDLIHRTSFYFALDDQYIQKKLSDIPENEQNLQKFHEEAIKVESQRLHFQQVSEKGNILEGSTGMSVNKFESSGARKWSPKSKRKYEPNRTQQQQQQHQQQHPQYQQKQQQQQNFNKNDQNHTKQKYDSNKKELRCNYCKKVGHIKSKCWKIIGYPESFGYKATYEKNDSKNVSNDNIKKVQLENKPNEYTHSSFKFDLEAKEIKSTQDNSQNNFGTTTICGPSQTRYGTFQNCSLNINDNSELTVSEDVNIKGVKSLSDSYKKVTKNIIGGVILNGIMNTSMELDTGACETMMTYDNFQKLSKLSVNPPVLQDDAVVRMADGTSSKCTKGTTLLQIQRADRPEMSGIFKVIVTEGPNDLLGRPVLEALWPDEYQSFVNSAKESIDAICSVVSCEHCGTAKSTKIATESAPATTLTESDPSKATTVNNSLVKNQQKKEIPPMPVGIITQEIGEAYGNQLCDEAFSDLFDGKQGDFITAEANFEIMPGHEKFLKVLPCAKVPYGVEDQFNEELDKLTKNCISVDGRGLKVASQIVPVVKKKDNKLKVRLCGNYKRTINDHLLDEPFQFTSINEQLSKLKGEYYSCVDQSGAYQQIKVGKGGELLTLTTPKGFKQPKRLPYGVKTAPKIYQSNIDRVIQGYDGRGPIPNTACVVDDICVTGATPEEHFANLTELLSRLQAAGLKLNREKCKFYQKEVKYLGKIIDKNGQRSDPETIEAIVNMPAPTDKHTLRSFLGHMSYIGKHVPDLRTARAPLDAMLKKDSKFVWEEVHSKAFNMCKELASKSVTLAHFDQNLPLVLTTDASPVGIGACLSHRITENGKTYLKPIAYASRSLQPSEKNYAQIDREGLAVYWAIKHFSQFLLGRKFELHTDCSALARIFGSKNDFGGLASGRLNRWAIFLMEYDFIVIHIKGVNNKVCDSLSRLPTPAKGELMAVIPKSTVPAVSSENLARNMSIKCMKNEDLDTMIESTYGIMKTVQCLAKLPEPKMETITICKIVGNTDTAAWDILPLKAKDIAKATREDKVLGKLSNALRDGNIDKNDQDLKPYISMYDEIYIENDVIYHGQRIIVPIKQRERLLSELHMTHTGVVKMKEVARKYFWWPQINQQIEDIARKCEGCNRYRKKPAPAPLCSWPFATRPMERVHIDYCEYKGKMLLVMIDAFSKYIWTHVCNADTTALKTCAVLYTWFCDRTGFPSTIVSDNGPQFTSTEFAEKMKKWGIKHILTPPYHPASNGLAEKAVGIVKDKLKKMNSPASPLELHINIQVVLRNYRATPHTSTGQTPYELISEAPVPVMFEHLRQAQVKVQEVQRSSIPKDKFGQARSFNIGDIVLVYDKLSKVNNNGIVKNIQSNNSFIVCVNNIDKHISADNMRLIQSVKTAENKDNINKDSNCDIPKNIMSDDLISDGEHDDLISLISDEESEYEFTNPSQFSNYNYNARKKYRSEVEKLNAVTPLIISKTRSGKVIH